MWEDLKSYISEMKRRFTSAIDPGRWGIRDNFLYSSQLSKDIRYKLKGFLWRVAKYTGKIIISSVRNTFMIALSFLTSNHLQNNLLTLRCLVHKLTLLVHCNFCSTSLLCYSLLVLVPCISWFPPNISSRYIQKRNSSVEWTKNDHSLFEKNSYS